MRQLVASNERNSRLLRRLKRLDRWVCYREAKEDNGVRKKPARIDQGEVTEIFYKNIEEWYSYKEAKEIAAKEEEISGIQTIITREGDDFVVVDIDGCIDPATGRVDPEAWNLVREANTYAEISQSGTGIHLIFRGDVPNQGWTAEGDEIEGEVYDKYAIVITENHIVGTPFTARKNEKLLDRMYDKYDIQWREELFDSNFEYSSV